MLCYIIIESRSLSQTTSLEHVLTFLSCTCLCLNKLQVPYICKGWILTKYLNKLAIDYWLCCTVTTPFSPMKYVRSLTLYNPKSPSMWVNCGGLWSELYYLYLRTSIFSFWGQPKIVPTTFPRVTRSWHTALSLSCSVFGCHISAFRRGVSSKILSIFLYFIGRFLEMPCHAKLKTLQVFFSFAIFPFCYGKK